VSVLHGDFWPEEESIEDFLGTLRDWRSHTSTDPARRRKLSLTQT
jgi:hypothetical protein